MNKQILHVLVVVFAVSIPAVASAGWTQEEGDGYLKVWNAWLFGDHAFDTTGELVKVEPFTITHFNLYGEYGLNDDWTVVGHGRPAGWASYGDDSTFFVGMLELGIRRALWTGPISVAMEARAGAAVPSGTYNLAAADEDVDFIPSVTQGRTSLELQVGYSFGPAWVRGGAGTRLDLTEEINPVAFASLQAGAMITDHLSGSVHLAWNRPFREVSRTNITGEGQTDYLGFGVSVGWWFTPDWAVSLGADGAFYARSNAGSMVPQVAVEYAF